MKYTQIGIITTYKCTAACRFCGLRCNPQREGVVSMELVKKLLDQAKEMDSFTRIGLTGGETFLYPELTTEILDYAKSLGFDQLTVASNGFWGGWDDEKIDCVLEGLEGKLLRIGFSTDSFHSEWVGSDKIWRAVHFATKHGFECNLFVADVHGEKGAAQFISSMGESGLNKRYHIYPLLPVGEADDMPDDMFVRECLPGDTLCGSFGYIAMDYKGDIYPCCNPAVFDTSLILGNINERPLKEILYESKIAELLQVMSVPDEFKRLVALARDEYGVEIPERVVTGCEICQLIFKKKDVMNKLIELAGSRYHEIMLQRIFGGG